MDCDHWVVSWYHYCCHYQLVVVMYLVVIRRLPPGYYINIVHCHDGRLAHLFPNEECQDRRNVWGSVWSHSSALGAFGQDKGTFWKLGSPQNLKAWSHLGEQATSTTFQLPHVWIHSRRSHHLNLVVIHFDFKNVLICKRLIGFGSWIDSLGKDS